jgi:hypothetical protein
MSNRIAFICTVLGGIAAIVAILAFFGLQPEEKPATDSGYNSAQSGGNAGGDTDSGSNGSGGGSGSGSDTDTDTDTDTKPTVTDDSSDTDSSDKSDSDTTTTDTDDSDTTATDTDESDSSDTSRTGVGIVTVPAGTYLYVHTTPYLNAPVTQGLTSGTTVEILCTVYSQPVGRPDGSASTLWDRISTGFVPDAYVNTGTNDPVAPACQ